MSVEEFLACTPQDTRLWQLVDGEPRLMSPPSVVHAIVQGELTGVIRDHLRASGNRCRVLVTPGVKPRVQANHNMRIPDLAVTCVRQPQNQPDLKDPLLIVEILSPSNEAQTWNNVWAYTTIPSVHEIIVVRTDRMEAAILRRGLDGAWPAEPETAGTGENLVFDSIGLRTGLDSLYRGTPFNPDED